MLGSSRVFGERYTDAYTEQGYLHFTNAGNWCSYWGITNWRPEQIRRVLLPSDYSGGPHPGQGTPIRCQVLCEVHIGLEQVQYKQPVSLEGRGSFGLRQNYILFFDVWWTNGCIFDSTLIEPCPCILRVGGVDHVYHSLSFLPGGFLWCGLVSLDKRMPQKTKWP